jgi:hypothetical protein
MADAAGPPAAGRVRFDACGVGSKHGDDREKPRPWEMPVVGRARLRLGLLLNAALSVAPASSSDELGSGGGRKQKTEKQPIRQIWRCVIGSPAQRQATWAGLGNALGTWRRRRIC